MSADRLIEPSKAELQARRYLIAKGYYDKESVPTTKVFEMLIEYTDLVQQMCDRLEAHAMELIKFQPAPHIIIKQPEAEQYPQQHGNPPA